MAALTVRHHNRPEVFSFDGLLKPQSVTGVLNIVVDVVQPARAMSTRQSEHFFLFRTTG
jgi:hypothetical protein